VNFETELASKIVAGCWRHRPGPPCRLLQNGPPF
jgi:hypothetical protein